MGKMVFYKPRSDEERKIIEEILDSYNKSASWGKCKMDNKKMDNKKMDNKNLAVKFCDAIKTMASKPENLDNFELYLTYHFPEWMKKYANDPESLVAEFVDFATMDIGDMDSRGNGDA